ncbi:hypothetical protein [Brachybacterium muris]|uniref:Uncharacterized protein n=1 Tax=Brachybacterium muris UCD-AY4 TaxID=1249481 RepID=A0A022KW81_9MICO|nr:hypothetical protein [Brachybacterium muris]EYT49037.1 hypothetical protein D641_0110125 [Brachybacterium muris UCD-AY4]
MTENPDFQTEPTTGASIDDALEAARPGDPERPAPAEAEGVGLDRTVERGQEDLAAAEQGNRDQDEMRSEGDDIDDLAGNQPLV